MTRDEKLETLDYARDQANLMHKEAMETLPDDDDKDLFLFLMECALEAINRRIDNMKSTH